jgi:6,7-dimethyl-8-ribityllumazine synthase
MTDNFPKTDEYSNIAVLLSSFHKQKIEKMLLCAGSEAVRCGLRIAREIWVPGAMEFPFALQRIFQDRSFNYKGVVVLGLIEKGETAHGLVMAQSVIPALIKLQLEFSKPLGVGILGPEIAPDQINSRLEPYAKSAVIALKKMLELTKKLDN